MTLNSNFQIPQTKPNHPLPKPLFINLSYELSIFTENNKNFANPAKINFPMIQETNTKNLEDTQIKIPVDDSIRLFLRSNPIQTLPEFKLILNSDIVNPICKGKYFTFKVLLKPTGAVSYPTNEKLELEALLFSNDDVLITKNMKGKEIIKGNYMQNMHYFKMESQHVAFFRIQITEVSSHYIGKTVTLKIKARKSPFLAATEWKIQSIVVPGLKVSAKKMEKSK